MLMAEPATPSVIEQKMDHGITMELHVIPRRPMRISLWERESSHSGATVLVDSHFLQICLQAHGR